MKNLTPYEIWYGRNTPPPEQVKLNAGGLDVIYQAGDLRYIRMGGVELIRRIYMAVRDLNWNTIPGVISDLSVQAGENSFSISYTSSHVSNDLDFRWQARIEGDAQGRISYSMDGTANTPFRFCRIGFCILHPVRECAGRPYQAETPGGLVTGTLPVLVEPQRMQGKFEAPLFPSCSSFTVSLENGAAIHTQFEGDLFEVEDQRNWTDGSYKTYCTPLSLGYPHNAAAGQRIFQQVTLWLEGQPGQPAPEMGLVKPPIHLSPGEKVPVPLPEIGFGLPSQAAALSQAETQLLAQLKPSHLKLEVHFKDPAWTAQLDSAVLTARQLGTQLELAIFLLENCEDQLAVLKAHLESAPVSRLIIFSEKDAHLHTTTARWMELARRSLGRYLPSFGGTNGNFAELNREWPDLKAMDGISYPINSQVHSSDEASLVEALQGQADTAITASRIASGLPVSVSAVTLKPPFNQAAIEEEAPLPPGELPAAVDPRQMSLFCAAWTLGSLCALAGSRVVSITYYETTGWRGLMEGAAGSPLPDKFLSQPGMVFPVYHLFADLADAQPASSTSMKTDDPLAATGMKLYLAGGQVILLANLTPEPQVVELSSLPSGQATIRRLNELTALQAMSDPAAFRISREPIPLDGSTLSLTLLPYEYIHLEIKPEG